MISRELPPKQNASYGWTEAGLQPEQRTIVVAASPGVISVSMAGAIEREFPWLHVHCVDRLGAALSSAHDPVELILIDLFFLKQLEQCLEIFMSRYPGLRLAFVTDTQAASPPDELCNLNPQVLRGILPLDVRLDVFLSSLRIILGGGTHFVAPPLRQYGPADTAQPLQLDAVLQADTSTTLARLTTREMEILGHLAEGSQNKVIAAILGLSEHTVKVHIHNLINKLGARNRTEAAACYLRETGVTKLKTTLSRSLE